MTATAALPRWSFGGSPAMADALRALVVAGTKTATCWPVGTAPPPRVGDRALIVDGGGAPRVVVETVEIVDRAFAEVDAAFAADEGEGDRSLDGWRAAHAAFFARTGGFAPAMRLWCERFRVVAPA